MMATKTGIPCDFCGAMDVFYYYATDGGVYYRCEACNEKWD